METRQTEAKSEGYSLQEESFRVFAEQQYLRKNRDTREIFASYREGYQDILSDAFDDGEERKGEPALPKVFFSYAWPILNEFPHEWWNQLFLVGLCQDLREFFGVEAYIDVIDSVDDAKKYMADNFSYNASEADSHDSKNLICIVGSQSYVEKCENDAFSTSMVRDEERYIHEIIDQYSNREYSLPSQQRPLMAFSLGIYQSCILSSFHGKILAHESHRYSYYQLLQAVLYKLVLFMPDGDEQKYRCRDFLASMRQNSLLEHLFKRTEDAIQDYYWSKAYREDIDDLRNTFNLQHWLEGELEDVLSAWDEGILEERKQTIEERPHYKAADAFLALLDPTMLTDEDVLVAKEVLKDRYLEESTIALFEDERPIPLEKLFVNLIIVKEDEQRKKDLGMKEAKREDFQVLTQHYDDIHTPKEEIDVKNIFKGSNNLSEQETPRTIELLGRAGIGKTTFLLYLLRQWALGESWLEGYQAMFYFPLKKVVHRYDKGGAYSMAEVLRKEFFLGVPDFTLEKANAYWRYVLNNSSRYLFVFDGYDEVASDEHPVVEMLFREAPHFIVTSRPEARIQKAGLIRKADLVLENIGFLEENIKTYITQFFDFHEEKFEGGEEKSEALSGDHPLLEWLTDHNAVKMMCRIPINLELICQLWSDDSPLFQRSSVSVDDLYETVFNKLIKRYLSKLPKFEKSIKNMRPVQWLNCSETRKVTLFLKHVAFEGVKRNRLIIDYAMVDEVLIAHQELCEDPDILLHLARSGLLKSIDSEATLSNKSFYFMHYSFQEYLAGCYIADTLESQETQNFISQYKYFPVFQEVMTYAASSMKNNISKLDFFYDLLLSAPRDLCGDVEFELLLRCGEAAGWPEGWKARGRILKIVGEGYEKAIRKSYRLYEISQLLSHFPNTATAMLGVGGRVGFFEILNNLPHSKSHVKALEALRLSSVCNFTEAQISEILEWVKNSFFDRCDLHYEVILNSFSLSDVQIDDLLDYFELMLQGDGNAIGREYDCLGIFFLSSLKFNDIQIDRLWAFLKNEKRRSWFGRKAKTIILRKLLFSENISQVNSFLDHFEDLLHYRCVLSRYSLLSLCNTHAKSLSLDESQVNRLWVWVENGWIESQFNISYFKWVFEKMFFSDVWVDRFCRYLFSGSKNEILSKSSLFSLFQLLNDRQVEVMLNQIQANLNSKKNVFASLIILSNLNLKNISLEKTLLFFEWIFPYINEGIVERDCLFDWDLNFLTSMHSLDFGALESNPFFEEKFCDSFGKKISGGELLGWAFGFLSRLPLTNAHFDRFLGCLDRLKDNFDESAVYKVSVFLNRFQFDCYNAKRVLDWFKEVVDFSFCVTSVVLKGAGKKPLWTIAPKDRPYLDRENFFEVLIRLSLLSLQLNWVMQFLRSCLNSESLHQYNFYYQVKKIKEQRFSEEHKNQIVTSILDILKDDLVKFYMPAIVCLRCLSLSKAHVDDILAWAESVLACSGEKVIILAVLHILKYMLFIENQIDLVLGFLSLVIKENDLEICRAALSLMGSLSLNARQTTLVFVLLDKILPLIHGDFLDFTDFGWYECVSLFRILPFDQWVLDAEKRMMLFEWIMDELKLCSRNEHKHRMGDDFWFKSYDFLIKLELSKNQRSRLCNLITNVSLYPFAERLSNLDISVFSFLFENCHLIDPDSRFDHCFETYDPFLRPFCVWRDSNRFYFYFRGVFFNGDVFSNIFSLTAEHPGMFEKALLDWQSAEKKEGLLNYQRDDLDSFTSLEDSYNPYVFITSIFAGTNLYKKQLSLRNVSEEELSESSASMFRAKRTRYEEEGKEDIGESPSKKQANR